MELYIHFGGLFRNISALIHIETLQLFGAMPNARNDREACETIFFKLQDEDSVEVLVEKLKEEAGGRASISVSKPLSNEVTQKPTICISMRSLEFKFSTEKAEFHC